MDARLPAHLEVSGLVRQVNAAGGFGVIVSKGEHDAGTILAILAHNGANFRIYERMPELDGTRRWKCTKVWNPENPIEFHDYIQRRRSQDPDLWVVELDIPNAERFIGE